MNVSVKDLAGGKVPLKNHSLSSFLLWTNDRKKIWSQIFLKTKKFLLSKNETEHKNVVDKKSHFRSFRFFALTLWMMLKVTNHGHRRRSPTKSKAKKYQTRTNINCRENIFRWIFCLLSMAGRTLLLYEPLQCPRWCNKISPETREIFETKIYFSCIFHLNLAWKKCKLFFWVVVRLMEAAWKHTGKYMQINANEIFTVTAIQHCSLLSFILLVAREKKMQRNHAGLNFEINYVWLKRTVKALVWIPNSVELNER